MVNHYGNFENGLILTLLVVVIGALFLLLARIVESRTRSTLEGHGLVDGLQD